MNDNTIKHIQTDDLRNMSDREGLILQGCGGDLYEWIDGINELFTEAGILHSGSRFKCVSAFEYDNHTNLLFDFAGVDIDIGKLAMWRLATYETFGGTWLSDFVPNRLHGFVRQPEPVEGKPSCSLIGQDGNIFHLVGIAARTLREAGLNEQAKELTNRIMGGECHSYGEALCLIGEYVTITGVNDHTRKKHGKEKDTYER